jgi:hypothetical protein
MNRFLWLALAVVVGFTGLAVGRALHLPMLAAVCLGAVPAFLVSFPFMKRWMPQTKFRYWAMAAALWVFFAWLLNFAFSRFGV